MSIQLAGFDQVLQRKLLELIGGRKRSKAWSLAEFKQHFEPRWTEAQLQLALARLESEGEIVGRAGGWVPLRATQLIVGTLQKLQRGDAIARTGLRGEPGYFVNKRRQGDARDGDRVLLEKWVAKRSTHSTRSARSGGSGGGRQRLPEARVVRVLARGRRDVVGRFLKLEGEERFVPFDPKGQADFRIDRPKKVPLGTFVVATRAESGAESSQARISEVLGDPAEPGVDVTIALRHYQIPEVFPKTVEQAASEVPDEPQPSDWQDRHDLRSETIITIDGKTARDFDDAIQVQRLSGGGYQLGVHIADVAAYVEEGSAPDLTAYERGTSVYFPERAVPMLPEELSNGLCSLRPEVPRLTLSAFLEFDPSGAVVSRRFAESVIRSSRRLTYSEVKRLLEEPESQDAGTYGPVLPMLEVAKELMGILYDARCARGSIDFDLPEGNVVLDTDGKMVGVLPTERNVAHRIIEEFMIAANEAVAAELASAEIPALFRTHQPPEPDRLEELRRLLASIGIELAGDLTLQSPEALEEVLERVAGTPQEAFVASLVLRSMQRAIYEPICRGHYALGSRYYTHFTSPIRRYPDLVVHRQLKQLLTRASGAGDDPAASPFLEERLPAMAEHCSDTERRAERAERDLLQWKKVRFLADRTGERFWGRVTGVQPFGFFLQLEEYWVDGLVPVDTLTDDFYCFEPDTQCLVGDRHGRNFRLADRVEVLLMGIDERNRGLRLQVAEMAS